MSKGRLCDKGLASLEHLYNPNPLPHLLKRVGESGEGRWERISREVALDTIAVKLKRMEALESIPVQFYMTAIERNTESFSSTDPRIRKIASPLMGHYNRWHKDISEAFEGNHAADAGTYCGEIDFDFSIMEPRLLQRLESLIDKYTWT